jgi:hypothetical protein
MDPITYTQDAGDLEELNAEVALAQRLAKTWKASITMVPLNGYGVEWAIFDKESEELKALLFFEHAKHQPKEGYVVRCSRIANGGRMAITLNVPLIAVVIKGKDSVYARLGKEDIAMTLANPFAVRQYVEGASELWLQLPPGVERFFKKESGDE